jgi:hypothetical protein
MFTRRPLLNGDGSLSLRYEHGDLFMDEGGNSCNRPGLPAGIQNIILTKQWII